MTLPARRRPKPSGIERAPRREFPRHRKFVRSHQCIVPGCESGPIEFMHVRSAADSGTGLKPPDWRAVSGCSAHHAESHQIGIKSFERKYGLSLDKLAAEFAKASPDTLMKQAMSGTS